MLMLMMMVLLVMLLTLVMLLLLLLLLQLRMRDFVFIIVGHDDSLEIGPQRPVKRRDTRFCVQVEVCEVVRERSRVVDEHMRNCFSKQPMDLCVCIYI